MTKAVTEAITQAADDSLTTVDDATSVTLAALNEAISDMNDARSNVTSLRDNLEDSRTRLADAQTALADVSTTLTDVQTALTQAQDALSEAQQEIADVTDAGTEAYVETTTALANATSTANSSVTDITTGLNQVTSQAQAAIDTLTTVTDANAEAIAELQEIVDTAGLDPDVTSALTSVIDSLNDRVTADQQLLTDLNGLTTDTSSAISSIQGAADETESASQQAATAAQNLRSELLATEPALRAALTELSTNMASFSATLTSQQATIAQASALLTDLDSQLVSAEDALDSLGNNLSSIADDLTTTRTDIVALSTASAWDSLSEISGLDVDQIASFVSSPVHLEETVLYPVNSYGSAMAALFTNLSLWIGAFVLMVIFKIEVDTVGVEGITVRQAYFARFLTFSALVTGQALIVTIGDLLLGVQTVNAAAFIVTGVLTSLAYLSIIYSLSVSFGHIGRGLSVLLVIMQIPGSSGIYPIETMPDFFQKIYPFLPFTYGIEALRETIGGFYGTHYWQYMAVLGVFVVLSFALGLFLRRYLANLNALFNQRIAATDLLIGENVQVIDRRYRLTDILSALANHDRFRDRVTAQTVAFTRRYRWRRRAVSVLGVLGMLVLAVLAMVLPDAKAALLGIWVLWVLLIMGLLVALEYAMHSFELTEELATWNDEQLRDAAITDGNRP